jgi:hypothetical protein
MSLAVICNRERVLQELFEGVAIRIATDLMIEPDEVDVRIDINTDGKIVPSINISKQVASGFTEARIRDTIKEHYMRAKKLAEIRFEGLASRRVKKDG